MIRTFVVQIHGGCEQQAASSLRDLGFTVHALQMLKRRKILPGMTWRQKQGIRTNPNVIVPLFPGYILTEFDRDEDQWFSILRQPGVIGLIPMQNERPVPMPISAAEDLLSYVGADGYWSEEHATARALRPWEQLNGKMVEVMEGPFASFRGLCEIEGDGRIRVLLNMFGRQQPVSLDWQQVEVV